MRKTLLAIAALAAAIICWGLYGALVLHGQVDMPTDAGQPGWLRPLLCIGAMYFLFGVVVPVVWLNLRRETGDWTVLGVLWSLASGVAAVIGTLGVVLALKFVRHPVYVMPIVFGGTAVVSALVTLLLSRRRREVGAMLLAGVIVVILGAVVVFAFAPSTGVSVAPVGLLDWLWWLVAVAVGIVGWGAFGPMLRQGHVAMLGSWFRPLLCVGLASLAVAVLLPALLLTGAAGQGPYTFSGVLWSMLGGAVGAAGVVAVVLAYHWGMRPAYALPIVFGGAPIVSTAVALTGVDWRSGSGSVFLAGLILLVAGSAMVLVLAKRGEGDAMAPPSRDWRAPENEAPSP
jgi:hypothetical protein